MLGWVRVLPLLAVAAASAVPPLPNVSWTVEDAVYFYNQGSDTDYFYQLLETAPEDHLLPQNDSAGLQQLRFTLMETECLKTDNKSLLEDCAFKEEGEIKVCSAGYIVELERHAIVISCDTATARRTRFRRWWIKKRRQPSKPRKPIRPSSLTNISSTLPQNDSAGPQQLRFTLMETECLKTDNKSLLEDCAFKEEGEIKVCSAGYIVELERHAIVISCDSATARRTRFRPWQIKRRRQPSKPRRPIRPSYGTILTILGGLNLHLRGR